MPKDGKRTRRSDGAVTKLVREFLEQDLAAIRRGEEPLSLKHIPPSRRSVVYEAEDALFAELIAAGQPTIFRARHTPAIPEHLLQLAKSPAQMATYRNILTAITAPLDSSPTAAPSGTPPAVTPAPVAPTPAPDDSRVNELVNENQILARANQSLEAKLQRLTDEVISLKEARRQLERRILDLCSNPVASRSTDPSPVRNSSRARRPKSNELIFAFDDRTCRIELSSCRAHWFQPEFGGILAAPEAALLARALFEQWQRITNCRQYAFLRIIYIDSTGENTPVLDVDFGAAATLTTEFGKTHQELAFESLAFLLYEFKRSLRGKFSSISFPQTPSALAIYGKKRRKFAYLRVRDGIFAFGLSTDFKNPQVFAKLFISAIVAISHLAAIREELSSPIARIAKPEWKDNFEIVNSEIEQLKLKEYQNWDLWCRDADFDPWPSNLTPLSPSS